MARGLRFFPRTLTGRIMLVTALGVLLVQGINSFIRYESMKGRAVVEASSLIVAVTANRLDFGRADTARALERRPAVRTLQTSDPLELAGFHSTEELAQRVAMHLESVYPEVQAVRFSVGPVSQLPDELRPRPRHLHAARRAEAMERFSRGEAALLSLKLADGSWLHSTTKVRTRGILPQWPLLIETLLVYIGVLIPLLLVIRQISKPLRQLNHRLAHEGLASGAPPLEPQGPDDVRSLIDSFNAAEQRVNAMLTEKDVMLGAIGHDLKTPLASLRVRIESVDDEDERAKMAATVEEMVQILDDILILARLGKSSEPPVLTDINALVEMVAGELDNGDRLSVTDSAEKCRATVRPVLLRRALRNLMGNALQYGSKAQISTICDGDEVLITIDDDGPGLAPDQLVGMFEPFARAETSRNRTSGGSGLGLTIARAIARAHGGDIVLKNRVEGGLRATLRLSQKAA
ncbi:MAG: two-component sensor histidine kinase [Sphingomonadales bacterium]|jgi:signal transduction histidine kinase|nr:two-component sensor histidine kinase [Sphingomonadales bacterium]MBK9004118.1 two-component sensor histidine kinase [Sphingomonadales bacterium]MBK9269294.1 two-component sensor histidine kinase [Sphingomonadales bacterium]MBP6433872.1 two-component sensor histidine kinase [Sphingorhabdus sp.]